MSKQLIVRVVSFSYKRSLPVVVNDHGGGYLFDCRCLPNPGRQEQYRTQTGRDLGVAAYLSDCNEVERFLASSRLLIKQSLERYLERGFDSLSIGYGCTGGQHRSVYCTEECRAWLLATFPEVQVVVEHQGLRELDML